MYMARSFMVHLSLHWTDRGSDDISLWPFAAKHVVWLYNPVPNRLSGLTPLELLMKSKADHRDLLRTHVWGCPAIVLDPKLQNDHKLPKWNRHARIGQFLGYSDERSSLVANVRHLSTGHVSPQFHVVFDDLFETVIRNGDNDAVVNSICDGLFNRNRELVFWTKSGTTPSALKGPIPAAGTASSGVSKGQLSGLINRYKTESDDGAFTSFLSEFESLLN